MGWIDAVSDILRNFHQAVRMLACQKLFTSTVYPKQQPPVIADLKSS